jgi:hypothetical protein
MEPLYIILLVVLVLGAAFLFLLKPSNSSLNGQQYKLKRILSENEKLCFNHLVKIYPEYYIFPQVSMGALLVPNVAKDVKINGKNHYAVLRGKIQSNMIDFLITDKSLQPLFIVELDDNSHNNKVEQDRLRDKNFSDAGLKTLRFRNKKGTFPTRKELDTQLGN